MSKISTTLRGSIFGILGAAAYGTNPLFALPLYDRGMNTDSLLFYRYFFALLMMGGFMLLRRKSFRVESGRQMGLLAVGGGLLVFSSITLFAAFKCMDSGLAATILFVYPLMVCAIMYLGFGVKQSPLTLVGLVVAVGGIFLLSNGGNGGQVTPIGILSVCLSSLLYAIYMVMLKVTSIKNLTSENLTFYSLLFSIPYFLIILKGGTALQPLPDLFSLSCTLGLAVFPSFCSFLFMAIAIKDIGPTKTAILGALEPVTALMFGITCFGESLSPLQIVAIALIIGSVIMVVTAKPPTQREK